MKRPTVTPFVRTATDYRKSQIQIAINSQMLSPWSVLPQGSSKGLERCNHAFDKFPADRHRWLIPVHPRKITMGIVSDSSVSFSESSEARRINLAARHTLTCLERPYC